MNGNFLKVSFLALLCTLNCSDGAESKQPIEPTALSQPIVQPRPNAESDIAVSDVFRQIPFVENAKMAGMLRAWKRIPNYGHYRKARPMDFVTAGWKETEFDRSYDYGELAGAYGLALFVVDKTLPKPKNMSLVVFVERAKNRCDIYWIYRDENLSALNLSRSSGDIFLRGTREDGTSADCEIQWSRKSRKWTCE
jgi:hypothetical protein